MNKTTVYLPDELRNALKRTAVRRGLSEAQLIRSAIEREVDPPRPKPRGALFSSEDLVADRVDELLEGFGEL